MNKLKVFLSLLFLTAIIRSTDVGECGTRRYQFNGIIAHYDILTSDGVVVSHDGQDCGKNWPELQSSILLSLQNMQVHLDEIKAEQAELKRLRKESKELIGATVVNE